jgi:hypothetical protein
MVLRRNVPLVWISCSKCNVEVLFHADMSQCSSRLRLRSWKWMGMDGLVRGSGFGDSCMT